MNKIFFIFSILVLLLSSIQASAQTTITEKEFEPVIGSWSGKLTYLDYSTNKPFTMPANLKVVQIEGTTNYIFYNMYPDEPQANSADTVSISNNGTMLNGDILISKRKLNDGIIEVVTETMGVDGNDDKPAVMKHIYTLGKDIFEIKKDIQFVGQQDWINRNKMIYKKVEQ